MAEFTYHLSSTLKRRVHSFFLSRVSRIPGPLMLIPWHVLRGVPLGAGTARGAASVSIPATVTHGLTGSGDDNGVASTITDGRQMASVQDKASPLVLSEELLDWLASLRGDALLPLFFHRNLRDFFG